MPSTVPAVRVVPVRSSCLQVHVNLGTRHTEMHCGYFLEISIVSFLATAVLNLVLHNLNLPYSYLAR
eukprot:SAG31_NODE_920_length_10987_cov_4.682757_4_plen_67_part_00